MYQCHSGNMESLGSFNESQITIEESNFFNGNNLLFSNGSLIAIRHSEVKGFDAVSILDYASQLNSWNSEFTNNDTIAKLHKASTFNTFGCEITSSDIGFGIGNDQKFMGNSTYKLYKTSTRKIKQLEIEIL